MATMCVSTSPALEQINESSSVHVEVEIKQSSGAAYEGLLDVVKWWVAKTRGGEVVFGPFELEDTASSFTVVIDKVAHVCSGRSSEGRTLIVYVETGYENRKHFAYNYEVLPLPSVPFVADPEVGEGEE